MLLIHEHSVTAVLQTV